MIASTGPRPLITQLPRHRAHFRLTAHTDMSCSVWGRGGGGRGVFAREVAVKRRREPARFGARERRRTPPGMARRRSFCFDSARLPLQTRARTIDPSTRFEHSLRKCSDISTRSLDRCTLSLDREPFSIERRRRARQIVPFSVVRRPLQKQNVTICSRRRRLFEHSLRECLFSARRAEDLVRLCSEEGTLPKHSRRECSNEGGGWKHPCPFCSKSRHLPEHFRRKCSCKARRSRLPVHRSFLPRRFPVFAGPLPGNRDTRPSVRLP
jgi:hypothetical protein